MRVELPLEELAAIRAAFPAGGKKLTAVAVYVAICELAAAGEEATNVSVAARAGGSEATIYNYLDPLAEAGVVEVDKRARGHWLYSPRAPQSAGVEGLRSQNAAMRGLLDDMGISPAQIKAREEAAA